MTEHLPPRNKANSAMVQHFAKGASWRRWQIGQRPESPAI
jgi:hypothetical protein